MTAPARSPAKEQRIISPLKRFLMQCETDALLAFIHSTKASWGVTRPHRMDDRQQSGVYRARIQIPGHLEHLASGDTPKAALCNALASYLLHKQEDFHVLASEEAA